MNLSVFLLAVVAFVGIFVGAGAMTAFQYSEWYRHKPIPVEPPVVSPELLSVLAAVPYTAIVLDANDQVLRADALAYTYGVVRDQQIVVPAFKEAVARLRRKGVTGKTQIDLPKSTVKDAVKVPISIRTTVLSGGQVLVLMEDLSGPNELAATRRDFISNVSHELKTPVGAIRLLAETVADSAEDTESVRFFAQRMLREADRLGLLIQDIIELSRITAAEPMNQVSFVNISEVVSEAIDRQRLTAEAKKVRICCSGNLRLRVLGDEKLLVGAVHNLLDNAVRYSEAGAEVSVKVEVDGEFVNISVTDTGPGIAPAEHHRIFERFYRVDEDRSRDSGGTGLGLSIVKHIVVNHGGTVTVSSELGRGATFTLVIPQAPDPENYDTDSSFELPGKQPQEKSAGIF